MDAIRAAVQQAMRARRAEAEAERLHRWIDRQCPQPTPERPWWLPRLRKDPRCD